MLASWLSESHAQRRRLPLEPFAVPAAAVVQAAGIVWQPTGLKRIEELSEQARSDMEGSRLAKLGS